MCEKRAPHALDYRLRFYRSNTTDGPAIPISQPPHSLSSRFSPLGRMSSSMASSPASILSVTRASSLPFCNLRHFDRNRLSIPATFRSRKTFFPLLKGPCSRSGRSTILRAELNEALKGDDSLNVSSSPESETKIEALNGTPSTEPSPETAPGTSESLSQFITQVTHLVKLVDSKDIVELQLKQLDCEVTIRKKEALPQYMPPATNIAIPPPVGVQPVVQIAPSPVVGQHSVTAIAPLSSKVAEKPAKSSLPPLKCPMPGTFYRSPAPGEPPFVKVGDKVKKGQVLCIIEAMKLMNEIESDQEGTLLEILVDDAKPVSVDTPLFVIQ